MELLQIDKEIQECHKCGDKVEKFGFTSTISLGKKSDIVLIGEAPANNGWRKSGVAWYDTNNKLVPSGIVLQRLLRLIDYEIEDTTFVEAIKCFPKDRKYLKECSSNCRNYLVSQLKKLNPRLVLTLGDTATKSVLNIKYSNFSEVAGKVFDYNGYELIPIYHPSPISPKSYDGNVEIFESVIKEKIKVYKID